MDLLKGNQNCQQNPNFTKIHPQSFILVHQSDYVEKAFLLS